MGIKKLLNLSLRIIFFSALIIFPFGQLFRIQLPNFPEIKLQPLDFLCFIFVLVFIVNKIYLREKSFFPRFFRIMMVFLGFAFISFLVNAYKIPFFELYVSFLYLLRSLIYFLFFWSLSSFLKENHLPVVSYLIFVGLAISILALGQYLLIPDTRFIYNFGWDEHYFRAIGSFLDPSFTALLITLSFIVWLNQTLSRKSRNFFWWVLGFILLVSIGLSFSRLSYGVLLLSAIIIFLKKKKTKLMVILFLVFTALIIFIPKPAGEGVNLLRTYSFSAKNVNFRQAAEIIMDNPIFGVGFNNYRLVQKNYGFLSEDNWRTTNAGAGADNSFLFTWATTGIFGLVTLVILFWNIIRKSYLLASENEAALLLFTGAVAIFISSFFINALFYPWVLFWLMLLLAKFTVEN